MIHDTCARHGVMPEFADSLIKSMGASPTAPAPGFFEIQEESDSLGPQIRQNLERAVEMMKNLTVGYGATGAPDSRAGGSAIQAESQGRLASTTPRIRERRKKVLKSLISKVREAHPGLAYAEAVSLSLKLLNTKLRKGAK